jgi:LAO/AO transport system kinase
VPGVGKSTFIEAFGMRLIDQGLSVAVLAVDPTSPVSGGSILGDRTRMARLSAHPKAFIRPSPSGLHFGGVTRTTRQSMFACEAFGFDVIIIETVGVGQSEYAVAGMVDVFVTLMLPNAGDALQGLKKGILEISDLLVVNKADGPGEAAARQAARQYAGALGESSVPGWARPVLLASALENKGIDTVWQSLQDFRGLTQANGYFKHRREEQRLTELRERMEAWIEEGFSDPYYQAVWAQVAQDLRAGRCGVEEGVGRLKEVFTLKGF